MKAIETPEGIKIFSNLPKTWNGVVGIRVLSDMQLSNIGFKDIIEPTLVGYEKKGDPYFDETSNVFKYKIIQPTQEEIDRHKILNEENEKNEFDLKRSNNGIDLIKQIRIDLVEKVKDGTITKGQYLNSMDIIYGALEPLRDGIWELTQKRLNDLGEPNTQPYKAIYLEVKQRVDDYLNQNQYNMSNLKK